MLHLNVFRSLNIIINLKIMSDFFQKPILLFLILISQLTFGQNQANSMPKTAVIEHSETCRSNNKHTYQIFVPSVDTSFKQLPLLVSIDPYGNGKLAVEGFKEAAQKYQAVVVGSNLIKNNDPNYVQEFDELISDVKSRFPVGKILFVGGFSGGARMALGYATNHKVDGAIACGALAQKEEIQALPCKIMCIIGMDDFNFIEAAPFVLDPMSMPSNLAIEMTKASHAWPGKELLQQALGYLVLSVMPPGNLTEKRKYVRDFVAEQKQRIDQLSNSGENLQAALLSHTMSTSIPFEREVSFLSVTDEITHGANFQKQVDELQKNIEFEANVRSSYYNALSQKDSTWWKPEIELLNSKIKTEKNEFAQQMYVRIKGFLGIVCYSLSSRFTQEKDILNLEKVLWVYRTIEPKNPDMLQFSKTLNQLKKNR
jgi:dienelactone hydrolase